jgi:hypothetical protein
MTDESSDDGSQVILDAVDNIHNRNKFVRVLATYGTEIERLNILSALALELIDLGTPSPRPDPYDYFILTWSSPHSKEVAWLKLASIGDCLDLKRSFRLTGSVFGSAEGLPGKLASISLIITTDSTNQTMALQSAKEALVPFANALRLIIWKKPPLITPPKLDDPPSSDKTPVLSEIEQGETFQK